MKSSPPLHCLFLHNYYQHAGGEDVSMAAEIGILRQAGHQVELLKWSNDSIIAMSRREKLALFWRTTWNSASRDQTYHALKKLNADLLHVQNFFPIASPSVYTAAHALDVPVIQHLRNFRLGCLNSYFYRDGQVCEACVGCNPWRGILHRCYRNSLPASLSLWQMIIFHRWRQTWSRDINAFITPSQFAAQKLIELGIPAERLYVKPNFVQDPLVGQSILPLPKQPTFVFVGRFSPEKGILELLRAWLQVREPEWRLQLVGAGPQQLDLMHFCREYKLENVQFLGRLSPDEVLTVMQTMTALLVPSHWYETFGRVVIEAFACGRPVIVSRLGALTELVEEGKTGSLVSYTDEAAWAERIRWFGHNPQSVAKMGNLARHVYLQKFTPALNYQFLMEIYQKVLKC